MIANSVVYFFQFFANKVIGKEKHCLEKNDEIEHLRR